MSFIYFELSIIQGASISPVYRLFYAESSFIHPTLDPFVKENTLEIQSYGFPFTETFDKTRMPVFLGNLADGV